MKAVSPFSLQRLPAGINRWHSRLAPRRGGFRMFAKAAARGGAIAVRGEQSHWALSPRPAIRSHYRLQPLILGFGTPRFIVVPISNCSSSACPGYARLDQESCQTGFARTRARLRESAIAILADRVECRKQCREIRTTPQDSAVNFSHISVRILRYTARAIRLTIRVPPRP